MILTAFLFKRAGKMTVDYNYLNMEPVGLESIQLQDELIEALDNHVFDYVDVNKNFFGNYEIDYSLS